MQMFIPSSLLILAPPRGEDHDIMYQRLELGIATTNFPGS